MVWQVYNGDSWAVVASGGDVIDSSKNSVYTNPSNGLYYRFHILNVGAADLKKYRCQAVVNGVIECFYIKLYFLSRYIYTLVIFIVRTYCISVGDSVIMSAM